jgi:hypothetical protein
MTTDSYESKEEVVAAVAAAAAATGTEITSVPWHVQTATAPVPDTFDLGAAIADNLARCRRWIEQQSFTFVIAANESRIQNGLVTTDVYYYHRPKGWTLLELQKDRVYLSRRTYCDDPFTE